MRLIYSDYTFTAAIGGSAGGSAFTAPDDGSALFDGRSGSVQGIQWIGGTQNTSSYVQLTITVDSDIDASAIHGGIGIANVTGLPVGTKVVVDGITKRLKADQFGNLNVWFSPNVSASNTLTVRIYNDVNGSSPIVASAEFAIGEIFMGRAIDLCTLMNNNPSADLNDPTAYTRSAGGQLWQNMRKPYRTIAQTLGSFSTDDAMGGAASSIDDGAGGKIDIQTLRARLAVAPICAVSMFSDDDLMQVNAFVARPTNPGTISLSKPPRWLWAPAFQEAS